MEFSRTRSLGSCPQLPEGSFVATSLAVSNTACVVDDEQKLSAEIADVKNLLDFVFHPRCLGLENTRYGGN